MKDVVFLKAGNAYGYGYSAGESGQVYEQDQTRTVSGVTTKDGKPVIETIARGFDWLERNGIVRAVSGKKADKPAADKPAAE